MVSPQLFVISIQKHWMVKKVAFRSEISKLFLIETSDQTIFELEPKISKNNNYYKFSEAYLLAQSPYLTEELQRSTGINFFDLLTEVLFLLGLHSKKPKDGFFLVASVPSGVDANSRELPTLSPSFDC